MKKFKLLIPATALVFGLFGSGCMKNCMNQMQSKQASFTFKAGDSTYIWNGDYTDAHVFGSRGTLGSSSGRDLFTIYAKGFNGDAIEIALYTAKFQDGEFANVPDSLTLPITALINNQGFGFDEHGDISHLTITSIHDSMADGSFDATMTNQDKGLRIRITQGEFHNVKILQ